MDGRRARDAERQDPVGDRRGLPGGRPYGERRGRRDTEASTARGVLPGAAALTPAVRQVVARQDGLATTAQLASGGIGPGVVGRRVRDGVWQRPFRGVVVLQSGPPTWRQRARAGLLAAGPGAALSHRSAGFVHGLVPAPAGAVEVSVPATRAVDPQPGLVVHRRRTMPFAGGALCVVAPEATVLDLVTAARDDDAVVALLCDAVRAGVLPGRVVAELGERRRQRHRSLVLAVLGDPDARVESPLELRYDRDVEQAHGLPRSCAQVRELVGGRWIRADRVLTPWRVRVELDGHLAHPGGRTDGDVWRDNAVLLERGEITLRYRWHHVVTTPCATAAQLAAALRAGGWHGRPTRCGTACTMT